jgi:hypothetical protein
MESDMMKEPACPVVIRYGVWYRYRTEKNCKTGRLAFDLELELGSSDVSLLFNVICLTSDASRLTTVFRHDRTSTSLASKRGL